MKYFGTGATTIFHFVLIKPLLWQQRSTTTTSTTRLTTNTILTIITTKTSAATIVTTTAAQLKWQRPLSQSPTLPRTTTLTTKHE